MPDGNQPFSGGSGPSWNDAMLAAGIIKAREAGLSEEQIVSGRHGARIRRQISRRGRRVRAVAYLVIAVVFGAGAVYDRISGTVSPTGSLVLAAAFGLIGLYQVMRSLAPVLPHIAVSNGSQPCTASLFGMRREAMCESCPEAFPLRERVFSGSPRTA